MKDKIGTIIGVGLCCGCAFTFGGPIAVIIVGIVLCFAK